LSWERIETRRNECFAALDKSSDGFVDKAEAEAALTERMMWRGTTMLRRIDANLDGRVTKDEFNRHAKERFTAADINDDGRITEADMPPGFAQRQAGDSAAGTGGDQDQGRRGRWRKALAEGITWDKIEARRADAFKRFDRNGDGVIDRADVEAGVKERAAYWAIRWVRSFDRNRDGKVDKAEYNRRAREDFAVRDVNGDGRITDDDLPPFMRGRGGPR
jgi:Ca2+-binding EF-hand superfamily protein